MEIITIYNSAKVQLQHNRKEVEHTKDRSNQYFIE